MTIMTSKTSLLLAAVVATTCLSHGVNGAFVPSSISFRPSSARCAAFKSRRALFMAASTTATEDESSSSSSSSSTIDPESDAKNNLMDMVEETTNNSPTGLFIVKSQDRDKVLSAVKELETIAPITIPMNQKDLLGDWQLLCTTTSPTYRENNKQKVNSLLPFFSNNNNRNKSPSKFQRALQDEFIFTQKIMTTSDGGGSDVIDRVDHVIEYRPPKSLSDLLDRVPDALRNLNLNPLGVSKSTVTLIHEAKVEDDTKIKLNLKSVMLSVAGTSRYLDPKGVDVLFVNFPGIKEFLNAGTFETTYVDDTLRISRSKVGDRFEQVRVFVRNVPSSEEQWEKKGDREAPLVDQVVDRIEEQVQQVMEVEEALEDAVGNVTSTVRTSAQRVQDALQGSADEIRNVTKDASDKIRDSVEDAMEDVTETVEDALGIEEESEDEESEEKGPKK